MARLIIFFGFFTAFGLSAVCQEKKTYQHYEQLWFQYFNQTRISKKWGIWFDAGYRTKDNFVDSTSTLLARVGAIYYPNKDMRLMGGYSFFNAYPLEHGIEIAQPEHRLWQQVFYQKTYSRFTLMPAIRFEQRWRQKIIVPDQLDDEFNFNYRLRFNFTAQYALTEKHLEKGDLSLVVGDEIMVNFGKQLVTNFDQNRVFAGLRYYFSGNTNLLVNYMNVYSHPNVPGLYRIFNTVRFSYFHSIDMRKHLNIVQAQF